MSLKLADMRARFLLQRPTGIAADGYTDVATVAGALNWNGGSEPITGGVPMAVGVHVIRVWFRADVRAEWRLVEVEPTTGRSFQISDYGDREGTKRVLELLCLEVH